jgi:alkylation response protein AidB-like acyl-CoA dehydrogenase
MKVSQQQQSTDQCFEVCNEALQLQSGYGYRKDYLIERYVRETRPLQIVEVTGSQYWQKFSSSLVSFGQFPP